MCEGKKEVSLTTRTFLPSIPLAGVRVKGRRALLYNMSASTWVCLDASWAAAGAQMRLEQALTTTTRQLTIFGG